MGCSSGDGAAIIDSSTQNPVATKRRRMSTAEHVRTDAPDAGQARPETEPVFIVGLGRSGTTLTSLILDRHSRISVCNESHFVPLTRSERVDEPLSDSDARALLDRLPTDWTGVGSAETMEVFQETDRTLRSLFDSLLRARMLRTGKQRYGEKTPLHFRYLDQLFEWYPAARIVFLVRDPRRVHASFLRSRFAPRLATVDRWAVSRALYWSYAVRELRRVERRHPGQVHALRFEDLVSDTEESVRNLCRFLGEPYEPDMIDVQTDNSSFDDLGGTRGVDTRVVQRPLDLSRWARGVHELVATPEMIEQGYDLDLVPHGCVRGLRALGFHRALHAVHRVARTLRGRP